MDNDGYIALHDLIKSNPAIPAEIVHTNETGRVDGKTARLHDAEIAGILNKETTTRLVETRVTDLSLMDRLGVAAANAILDKLTAAGAANSAIRRAMKAIESERGIDLGNLEVRAMLDTLAASMVLTVDEVASLKGLAVKTCGAAEADPRIGRLVTGDDVSIALRGV